MAKRKKSRKQVGRIGIPKSVKKPYVLITVSGGVADIGINEGADIDILDYDNLKAGGRDEFAKLSDRERAYVLKYDPDFQLKYEDAEAGGR